MVIQEKVLQVFLNNKIESGHGAYFNKTTAILKSKKKPKVSNWLNFATNSAPGDRPQMAPQ